jgi:hypothetical protein
MRGYRPSSFPEYGLEAEEDGSLTEVVRQANIPVYARRAEDKLPLFDAPSVTPVTPVTPAPPVAASRPRHTRARAPAEA